MRTWPRGCVTGGSGARRVRPVTCVTSVTARGSRRRRAAALIDAAQAGDRRAREELVEAFLPLIAGVARVYRGSRTITRLELMQEGVVGLLRALERYDPELGVPFWGYAAWWVRQAMQQLIAELTRPLVLSDRALRQLSQLKRAHGEYLAEHGREPSGNELAVSTGLTHAQVGEMLALERVPQSMDEPVQGAEGELGAFGELLADPLAGDAYEQLLDYSEIEQIRALLGSLNDRERMVLRARYGLDGSEQSLRDIGERIGLSAANGCGRSRSAPWASFALPPPAASATDHTSWTPQGLTVGAAGLLNGMKASDSWR